MLLFEHLLLSLLIAGIFALITRRIGLALTFAFANVIIDIIDKPLGYMLVGTGRFILHSLVIVIIIGAILYIILRNNLVIAFVSGMLFHQICDQMWLWVSIWLFPLLGNPFRGGGMNLISGMSMCCDWEIQPTEIVFAIVSIIIIIILLKAATSASEPKVRS